LPLRLWEARVVRDLLRGRDALPGAEPRTTATAEPGVRCVLGAAGRATHPVTSVTYLAGRGLITSRDPVGACDILPRYRMTQSLVRRREAAMRPGKLGGSDGPPAGWPRSFMKQGPVPRSRRICIHPRGAGPSRGPRSADEQQAAHGLRAPAEPGRCLRGGRRGALSPRRGPAHEPYPRPHVGGPGPMALRTSPGDGSYRMRARSGRAPVCPAFASTSGSTWS
jgi:hypothetical protein